MVCVRSRDISFLADQCIPNDHVSGLRYLPIRFRVYRAQVIEQTVAKAEKEMAGDSWPRSGGGSCWRVSLERVDTAGVHAGEGICYRA
jgi:hypothetical protein